MSDDIVRVGDIEIAQDLRYQRRSWRVQRVAWVVMLAVTVAALLGYFGEGPRSEARVVSADGGYAVEYPRYTRHRAPEVLRVELRPGSVRGDAARIAFERRYLDGVEVESVLPDPDSVEADGDHVVYVFKLGAPGAPATIVFSLLYEDTGAKSGRVLLDGHPAVSLSQFVYP